MNARAETIEAAARKLTFEVILSEQTGNFAFGTTTAGRSEVGHR